MKRLFALGFVLLIANAVVAHPHFRKTVSAKMGDNDVSVSFFTVPANMDHVANTADGAFVMPGRPTLKIPAEMKAGSVSIPAGTYTVGAIKNSAESWTMALSPGELGRGEEPDKSKLIKLDSQYMKGSEGVDHLMVDIVPGYNKSEGKAVLVIGFGTMFLDGVISDMQ